MIGNVSDPNYVFDGLRAGGGGVFLHLGGGMFPIGDIQIIVSSLECTGNTVINQYLYGISGGGGIMASISSGSDLTMSSIDVTNLAVSDNIGGKFWSPPATVAGSFWDHTFQVVISVALAIYEQVEDFHCVSLPCIH